MKVGTSHELQEKGEAQGVGALRLGGVPDPSYEEPSRHSGSARGIDWISKLIVGLIGIFEWLEKALFNGQGELLADLLCPRS